MLNGGQILFPGFPLLAEVSRCSGKFPVACEIFPLLRKVSRCSGKFPVARGSFPLLRKVSRCSRKFPVARGSFPLLRKVSRCLRKFPVAREIFPWLAEVSRCSGKFPVARKSFPLPAPPRFERKSPSFRSRMDSSDSASIPVFLLIKLASAVVSIYLSGWTIGLCKRLLSLRLENTVLADMPITTSAAILAWYKKSLSAL